MGCNSSHVVPFLVHVVPFLTHCVPVSSHFFPFHPNSSHPKCFTVLGFLTKPELDVQWFTANPVLLGILSYFGLGIAPACLSRTYSSLRKVATLDSSWPVMFGRSSSRNVSHVNGLGSEGTILQMAST